MNLFNFIKKNSFAIIITVVGSYWVYDHFSTQSQIDNLRYGTKANTLRESLHIPIIDVYMSSDDGIRWESNRELPEENETLHAWKYVTTVETDPTILTGEWDAYRKLDAQGRVLQFNMLSQIDGDSVSIRKGNLFYFEEEYRDEHKLGEAAIDSICKSWGLDYLVKG
ncbi:hypothetical protein [Gilvibacter sediminis]|uniref:hypothetical protein n=1 Tax=Gilvibacter sediminis TaxID=379071 RepID=UPI002350E68D|nr:hypothetical protein [Gilvibacter sediminis]MDC7998035.1 hypothetical protein [Gilvibacter sediminis]